MHCGIWKLGMQPLRKPPSASTSSPNPEVIWTRDEIPAEPTLEALTSVGSAGATETTQSASEKRGTGARTVNRAGKPYRIARRRYFRIGWFFSRLFLGVIVWEVVIRRIAGLAFVARGRSKRSRQWSRRFRMLASEMGGVMIKLGQFVSSRVDVLPPEI